MPPNNTNSPSSSNKSNQSTPILTTRKNSSSSSSSDSQDSSPFDNRSINSNNVPDELQENNEVAALKEQVQALVQKVMDKQVEIDRLVEKTTEDDKIMKEMIQSIRILEGEAKKNEKSLSTHRKQKITSTNSKSIKKDNIPIPLADKASSPSASGTTKRTKNCLILGDSHVRDLKHFLKTNKPYKYEFHVKFQPGARFREVSELHVANKPYDDIVIIAGTNDNVRGIRTKTNDLYINTSMQENDVIILSETWLKSDINDAELLDDNYQIFRRDRDETTTSKGRGGGLLIAVRNHLEAYMIEDWTVCEAAYECLWVKMKLPYYLGTLLICCVYLPPPVSALNMELFSTYLESLSENLHHNSFMREHRVQHEKALSEPFYPPSSIPQGSKLSGLKFIVMINGIQQVIKHSQFELYADDIKLYKTINSLECSMGFQEDLNACQLWLLENKLKFHPSKCEIMTITNRKQNIIEQTYNIENTPIPRVNQKKDLGVIFQSNLKFDQHINNIVSKSNQILGFIQRNTKYFSNIDTMLLLYSAYIRSKLDYACNIWSPTTKNMIKKIENVQAKFVRYLFYKENGFYPSYPEPISYKSLCDSLQLMSLENRRILFYLVFIYKTFNNLINVPDLRRRLQQYEPAVNLRQRNIFFDIPLITSSLHKKTPIVKAMEIYNRYHPNLSLEISMDQYREICKRFLLEWEDQ
ncbi:hypothetical protein M8J77_021154 [Diaphorina citri]|nr:hypothetical protein M8J77_021154 [Diaphorina citri]